MMNFELRKIGTALVMAEFENNLMKREKRKLTKFLEKERNVKGGRNRSKRETIFSFSFLQ